MCGIDPDTLRTVARTYAKAERGNHLLGDGGSRRARTGRTTRAASSRLPRSPGTWAGRGPGCTRFAGRTTCRARRTSASSRWSTPTTRRWTRRTSGARFEDAWGTSLDPERGLTVVEIMHAILDDEIKGMYIMGENPAMSDPDMQHAREALAKLEHLVVQDLFLTETAFHADVVLPASAWPEKDGTVTNTNRQVQLGRRALPLPGDARQDWWIVQEIARRLGLDWRYEHPRDVFREMTEVMPSLDNITWERLERESGVTYPCLGPEQPGEDIVFGDGFPTETGRAKLVPALIVRATEEPDDEYPMVLTTGRQLEHWHTGAITRRAGILDALEPEAVASLSPADLGRLGLAAGAPVRISTRRGEIEIATRRDPAVPEGMVFVPFCYAEAAANVLTSPSSIPSARSPASSSAPRASSPWRSLRPPPPPTDPGAGPRPDSSAPPVRGGGPRDGSRSARWRAGGGRARRRRCRGFPPRRAHGPSPGPARAPPPIRPPTASLRDAMRGRGAHGRRRYASPRMRASLGTNRPRGSRPASARSQLRTPVSAWRPHIVAAASGTRAAYHQPSRICSWEQMLTTAAPPGRRTRASSPSTRRSNGRPSPGESGRWCSTWFTITASKRRVLEGERVDPRLVEGDRAPRPAFQLRLRDPRASRG